MQIRAILNPSTYHGTLQKPPFFEGWYFKMVSADEKHKIAIIPGIILGKDEIKTAYATGKGQLTVRSKVHTEDLKGGRSRIVITASTSASSAPQVITLR